MPHHRGWFTFVAIGVVAAVADLATKASIFARLGMPGEQPGIVLVPGMLSLETNLNEGALFGMGQGLGVVFAAVSLCAIGGILWMVSRPATRSDRYRDDDGVKRQAAIEHDRPHHPSRDDDPDVVRRLAEALGHRSRLRQIGRSRGPAAPSCSAARSPPTAA